MEAQSNGFGAEPRVFPDRTYYLKAIVLIHIEHMKRAPDEHGRNQVSLDRWGT